MSSLKIKLYIMTGVFPYLADLFMIVLQYLGQAHKYVVDTQKELLNEQNI